MKLYGAAKWSTILGLVAAMAAGILTNDPIKIGTAILGIVAAFMSPPEPPKAIARMLGR